MTIFDQIETLYQSALSLQNDYLIVDIGVVDETFAERIKKSTGFDFTGYVISIDNYSIKHILEKHGNPIREAKRGQISITKEDFLLLPKLLFEFDSVKYDVKIKNINHTKRESLIFEKTIGDTYFVVKEIRTVSKKGKVNKITLQTMYKRKALSP